MINNPTITTKQSFKPLLKKWSKTPIEDALIITLLFLAGVMLPISNITKLYISNKFVAVYTAEISKRFIIGTIGIFVAYKMGFIKSFINKPTLYSLLLTIPFLVISINNAPIVGLVSGAVRTTRNPQYITLYILYCLSVGYYEEIAFRGLIFPLFLQYFSNKKYGARKAILLSSLFFAFSHLINLLSNDVVWEVFFQVGYTFVIGSMFAISLVLTKSIYVPIILHTIYDIGGLIIDRIGIGNQWDIFTIITTIILGITIGLYSLYYFFTANDKEIENNFIFSELKSIKSIEKKKDK